MSTVNVAASLTMDDPSSSLLAKHERHIPMVSFHNLRTLGGLTAGNRVKLKANRLYRSDSIAFLQAEDQDRLQNLQLAVVTDFRSVAELNKDPYQHRSEFNYVQRPIPVMGENGQEDLLAVLQQVESEEEMIDWLCERYRSMVAEFSGIFSDWLQSLLDESQYPQLFHCTAGKDRTGVATALLLKLLGAPDAAIMDDFLLSNTLSAEHIERKMAGEKVFHWLTDDVDTRFLRPLLGVRKEYLKSTFDFIQQEYGDFEHYARQGLRFDQSDLKQLKEVLLEKA